MALPNSDDVLSARLNAVVKHPRTIVLVIAEATERYIRLPIKAPVAYYETHTTPAQLREAVAYHGGAVAAIAITRRLRLRMRRTAADAARRHGVPLVRLW